MIQRRKRLFLGLFVVFLVFLQFVPVYAVSPTTLVKAGRVLTDADTERLVEAIITKDGIRFSNGQELKFMAESVYSRFTDAECESLAQALGNKEAVQNMPGWFKVTLGTSLAVSGFDLVTDLVNSFLSGSQVDMNSTSLHGTDLGVNGFTGSDVSRALASLPSGYTAYFVNFHFTYTLSDGFSSFGGWNPLIAAINPSYSTHVGWNSSQSIYDLNIKITSSGNSYRWNGSSWEYDSLDYHNWEVFSFTTYNFDQEGIYPVYYHVADTIPSSDIFQSPMQAPSGTQVVYIPPDSSYLLDPSTAQKIQDGTIEQTGTSTDTGTGTGTDTGTGTGTDTGTGTGTETETQTQPATEGTLSKIVTAIADFFDFNKSVDWSPIQNLGIEVTNKFPFSLPWDVKRAVEGLVAEGKLDPIQVQMYAPSFVSVDNTIHFEITWPDFVVSLAPIVRSGLLIVFTIALVYLTRTLMGGGQ